MDTKERQLGDVIRHARESRGKSRRQAAKESGLSESRWRQLESGVQYRDGMEEPAKATPLTLAKIAKYLGLDVVDILEMVGFTAEDARIATNELENQAQARKQPPQTAVPDWVPDSEDEGGRIIRLNEFPPEEAAKIEGFIWGLKAARKPHANS